MSLFPDGSVFIGDEPKNDNNVITVLCLAEEPDNIDVLTEFIKTKNSKWSYEEERRIILPLKYSGKQLLSFKKESLGEIIFGMNIDPNHKRTIMDVIDKEYINKGFDVELYDAKMKHGTYRLDLKRI
jgi:hypothetical protein